MRHVLPGFELDVQRARLLCDGRDLDLEPKVFDLLCYLIEHPHRLLSKQELKLKVWQVQRLSDVTIAAAIAKLRRALDQSGDAGATIETIRGRGYIFHLQAPQAAPEGDSESLCHPLPSVPLEEPDPFVGRVEVLDGLSKKLERARGGSASLVLISGPAGIGKTRLVEEFLGRAEKAATPAWSGAAYEGEGFPPYWPWMQIVREAQRRDPSSFARALPKGAQLLPNWISSLGPAMSSASEALDPQVLRFRLFDELTRCLGALAADGPRILVLDDLQWADVGSIDLLGHALRALASCPILFLATLRDEEPLPRNVDEALSKLSRATRVRLMGLNEQESRTLAHALQGTTPPSEDHLAELFRRSGGSPFFIRQFLGWWSAVGANPERRDDLPPGARDLVRRRLALLPSPTHRVLTAASVLGARFRALRLSQMLNESIDEVLQALAVGTRFKIIVGVPGTDEFEFTHGLLQEALYEDTDPRIRGTLHSRAADSFGTEAVSATISHLGERARHLVHALPSRLEEAVRACENAAKVAQRSAGFERANDLLSLAIRKLEVESSSPDEQARLWTELGDNLFFAAVLDQAWQAYRKAAELLLSTGNSLELAELAAPLVRCVNQGAGDAEFARALVEEVLRTLPPVAARERGRTLAKKAQVSLDLSTAERTALLDEALACADDPVVRLEVAYARNILRDPATLESNVRAASEFLALIEAEDPASSTARYRSLHLLGVHITRYVSAVTSCDLDGADQIQAAIAQLAETSHVRAAQVVLLMIRAGRALAEGRLDELAALLAGSVGVLNDTFSIIEAHRSYQLLLLEARGAFSVLEKLELPPLPEGAVGTLRYRSDLAIAHAYMYARTGRPERALDMLGRVPRRDIERMPVLYGDLGVLTGLARIYTELGDEPGMRLIYEKLSPFAGRNALMPTFAYRGAVDHYLGMLSLHLGDRVRAREQLLAAVEINRRLKMPRHTSESEALLCQI